MPMFNSRNIIRFQWIVIVCLAVLYWLKQTPCPEVSLPEPSRTINITYHDSTPKVDTVVPKKTGIREKIKSPLVAPPTLSAQAQGVDTVYYPLADSCDQYLATSGDSMVDIEVSYCSSDPVQDFSITYRHKGIRMIEIIDSIPYAVGFKKAIYAGAVMNTGGGIGPSIQFYNPKMSYGYNYDFLLKQHHFSLGWKVWSR
jgi:hypothetical protein